MSRMLRLVLVSMAFAIFAPALYGQNAVVLGTVYDNAGNGLAGITVLLENKTTNFSRVTTTGADGTYSIAEVPPAAKYKITALKQGAEIDVRDEIEVNVGDERSILPGLREKAAPGAPGTDTSATGTATPVPTAAQKVSKHRPASAIVRNETTATSIGSPTTSEQLRTLPLYNRNFLSLGLLAPNTHDTEAGSALTGASFSISGLRPSSNNFLLDGFDNVASNSNQAIPFQVNEAIQEFRVTSATANAEFGRGAGGVVSVVTRRGTADKWHGGAFGYFANNALNSDGPISIYRSSGFDRAAAFAGPTTATAIAAPVSGDAVGPRTYNQYVATAAARGYCTNSITAPQTLAQTSTCAGTTRGRNDRFNPAAILAANDSKSAPFFSKQFGGNLGGPIRMVKNLVAFVSYESTLIDNPAPIFERVPSAFDRQVRTATPGNPAANYTVANRIVNLFPQANVVGVPGVLEFYKGEAPNYTKVHNVLSRLDYNRKEDTFNLRYTGQILDQLHDSTLPAQAAYAGNGAIRKAQNQNGAFTWTRTLGKGVINEGRVGITQFRVTDRPQDSGFNATTLGLPNTFMPTVFLTGLDTQYSGAAPGIAGAFGGWYDSFWAPTVTTPMLPSLDGIFPFARLGAPLSAPSVRRDTTYAATDNLSWRLTKHNFKFGGEYRFIQNRGDNSGFARGIMQSGNIGEFTSDSEACNTGVATDAAAVTGPCLQAFKRPSFDYALNSGSTYAAFFESHNFAGYGQDQWKVGKGVTVNMGVRYEFFGVPKERNNQIWNFQPEVNGLVQQGSSTVLDPYGYICKGGGSSNNVTNLDSVTRNRTSPVFWSCGTSGNPNLLKQDYSDFAGRGGIAWDMFGNGRTVIRAGVGIFYDQTPIQNISQLIYNRPTQLNLSNPRFIYGQNFLTQVLGPGGNYFPNAARPTLVCQQCGLGVATMNTTSAAGYQPFLQAAASPFVLYARAKNSSATPYTRQTSVTIQHSVTDNLAGEVGYIGAIGRRIPFVNNTGYANEWFCNSSTQPVTGFPTASQPTCDNFSYYPVFTMANVAESNYHSLMMRARLDKFHGLRMNATYTWSKAMDNASSNQFPLVPTPLFTQAFGLQFFGLGNPFGFSLGKGGNILGRQAGAIGQTGTVVGSDTFSQSVTTTGAAAVNVTRYSLPQNPLNALADDHGRADFDVNHRLVIDFNYELPLFKQLKLRGLQMSGIFAAQSGQPYTIFSGPLFGELTQRVSLSSSLATTGDPNNYFASSIGNGIVLPAVVNGGGSPATQCGYAQGATLYGGTVGSACSGNTKRNQFTGPNYINLDLAVQKGFKVFGEGRELTLRTEVFNVFNRANYYNPNSIASLDGFNANPEFGQIKSAKDPRQFQFAIRFSF